MAVPGGAVMLDDIAAYLLKPRMRPLRPAHPGGATWWQCTLPGWCIGTGPTPRDAYRVACSERDAIVRFEAPRRRIRWATL